MDGENDEEFDAFLRRARKTLEKEKTLDPLMLSDGCEGNFYPSSLRDFFSPYTEELSSIFPRNWTEGEKEDFFAAIRRFSCFCPHLLEADMRRRRENRARSVIERKKAGEGGKRPAQEENGRQRTIAEIMKVVDTFRSYSEWGPRFKERKRSHKRLGLPKQLMLAKERIVMEETSMRERWQARRGRSREESGGKDSEGIKLQPRKRFKGERTRTLVNETLACEIMSEDF
eukprot:TRINITY_DN19988_c0_g1_i1.p1 TRINITY_DN19988_c0_g1~~TRINITY_DN19988_c0_g1_i1.p1  ORF type:complete len:245 (+),score=71.14 TRINITY_DN19988_c0_g1_i1:51-737(+)